MNRMERGSNPVSPREDDERKHELEGYLRSGRHTHAEEAYDPEPTADDDVAVHPGGPVPPPGEAREQAEAQAGADALRLELARHLDRTVFPADRRAVLRALEESHAPEPVLEEARRLPEDGTFHNADEIVRALGHRPTT
ncbi:hypothetical protein QFZ82_000843 [Streptomyces sp. V4I23]|uniref:DUF2795 domain-containing protein n=1 Tax=Streptomyces sp. V4I23 TaxID=3042282 RepID=UPI002789D71A|nr:DUF2795 domain-containing protein [Streptomyces sp. V4I23]MDQ1006358.1 hypothetical protein [Streptomyces sp. V4I23]